MEVYHRDTSDRMKKIEKQSIPKVKNLLRWKVNVKTFQF